MAPTDKKTRKDRPRNGSRQSEPATRNPGRTRQDQDDEGKEEESKETKAPRSIVDPKTQKITEIKNYDTKKGDKRRGNESKGTGLTRPTSKEYLNLPEQQRQTDTQAAVPALSTPVRDITAFVNIPFNDFPRCCAFIEDHPNILGENTETLQKAAIREYKHGSSTLGDQIAQRIAILHHCQTKKLSWKKAADYVRKLGSVSSPAYQEHETGVTALIKRLRQVAKTQDAVQSEPAAMPYRPATNTFQSATPAYAQPSLPSGQRRPSANPVPDLVSNDMSMNISSSPPPTTTQSFASSDLASSDLMRSHPAPGMFQYRQHSLVTTRSTQYTYNTMPNPSSAPTTAATRNPNFQPGGANPSFQRGANEAPVTEDHPNVDDPPNPTDRTTVSLTTVRDAYFQANVTGQGDYEGETYERRSNDAKNFFRAGRVFKLWWHESAGRNTDMASDRVSRGPQGQIIHTKQMWMVVVVNKDGYCICCPIQTYRQRGLTKSGLKPRDIKAHAIIYSEGQPVTRVKGEPVMVKQPIMVKMNADREPIHFAARVHFGRYYTVNWDTAILDMGRVVAGDREALQGYFRTELQPNT